MQKEVFWIEIKARHFSLLVWLTFSTLKLWSFMKILCLRTVSNTRLPQKEKNWLPSCIISFFIRFSHYNYHRGKENQAAIYLMSECVTSVLIPCDHEKFLKFDETLMKMGSQTKVEKWRALISIQDTPFNINSNCDDSRLWFKLHLR